MFERWTESARQVVMAAQNEARSLGCDHINVDHFLLGLLTDDESVATYALNALGVTYEDVRSNAGRDSKKPGPESLPFTPRARNAIELALREALGLGSNYVATEHILLGLLRENGPALDLVERCGTDSERVRAEVLRLVRGAEPRLAEAEYAVYRWEEPGSMTFERRLFIKHEIGEQVTAERVRKALSDEIYDFKPAKYRVIPLDRWIDVEVKGEVVLS